MRKTGVMGILKLHHLAPELVKGSNMVDLLYNMIQDQDAHVSERFSSLLFSGPLVHWPWQRRASVTPGG